VLRSLRESIETAIQEDPDDLAKEELAQAQAKVELAKQDLKCFATLTKCYANAQRE